ncbi:transposase [Pendulispora rubella]|uniref:transposase n=1 Tax=Pendulispora rubella TaxID=2741070 RepID=UPI00374E19D3
MGQVAKDLDLAETALRSWIERAEADAADVPKESLSMAERDELTKLRQKVKRLEMGRDILKSDGPLREGRREVCVRPRGEGVVPDRCAMQGVGRVPKWYYA